jgi:hypothetical protein
MILKLGAVERTLSHVLTQDAMALTQDLEVVENTSQHPDILLQVRAKIMRVPPQVVYQALASGIGEVRLYAPFLQCLGCIAGVWAEKTASRNIHRNSSRCVRQ